MLPSISGERHPLTQSTWEQLRRPEILNLFRTHVYGNTPSADALSIQHVLSEPETLPGGHTRRFVLTTTLRGNDGTCSFHTELFVPANATTPLPAAMMVDTFSQNPEVLKTLDRLHGQMPYDLLNGAGFIGIYAHVDELCIDDPIECQTGLMSLLPRKGDDGWGCIGVWAFAASRVVDFLCAWDAVDATRIAICGCSRAGKTALWCSAQDTRIALTISNVSGCTGAAITRGKTGEHIRDITSRFPHWMCDRYATYAEDEEGLPVDQHMLLALCAPRPLYVSSASNDDWADPRMEFASAKLAGEIFMLYGEAPLAIDEMPPVNTPSLDGDVAYHIREGDHGCEYYDWEQYIRFMRKYF